MGSLTQSLLASSADKRAEDAEAIAKQSEGQAGAKTASSAQSGKGVSSDNESGSKKPLPKLPGAQKVGAIGTALGSFHDGGTVPKTGPYVLHKGEEVIPAKRASEYRKVYLGRKSKKD